MIFVCRPTRSCDADGSFDQRSATAARAENLRPRSCARPVHPVHRLDGGESQSLARTHAHDSSTHFGAQSRGSTSAPSSDGEPYGAEHVPGTTVRDDGLSAGGSAAAAERARHHEGREEFDVLGVKRARDLVKHPGGGAEQSPSPLLGPVEAPGHHGNASASDSGGNV